MGERFYGVQALRFAAATAVVVTHAVDLAGTRLGLETVLAGGTLENFGAVGVDVFFVISGFIIATTTEGQTGVGAAGAFLWRRFRRVAPIYWLLSLPILIGMARGGTLSADVAAATFLFWPFSGLEMTFPALGPGWTLCFEMLFYAGFGLAIAGARRVGWGLIGAYAAMLAAGLVVAAPVLRFLGAPIILEFLLGVGIASIWRFAPRRLGLWAVGLAVLGFALGLVFGYGGIDDVRALNDPWNGLRRAAVWGLPSALLVFGVVRMQQTDRVPGRLERAAAFMGDASYSIYLVHVLVIRALGRLFESGMVALPGDAVVGLTVIASLAAGALVHVWIERPLLKVMTPSPAGRGLERPRA
ncbi:glucans biosynthesis protein [Brevundimonas vesicularis]|uniref:Glucans biosynthesis protein n=1 Tax=Brevundimonas vesicularis TaxID=41276 RepID=A0A2X1BM99_BREVE|nr:acyltransferase [Brevundimonas vesicularis]SPU51904.1 glucans biosynthesis protein [Brevundimonas vesicularis]